MDNRNVEISLERYEQLINVESRVNVAIDLACSRRYIEFKELLLILGTEEAKKKEREIEAEESALKKNSVNDACGGLFNESE